jgi:hypothetical protein
MSSATSAKSTHASRILARISDPRVFALVAALIFVTYNLVILRHMADTASGRAALVKADAAHYVRIAREFASGNFSMDYVQKKPHRQPLYPACLAIAVKLGGGYLFWLGTVNITLSTLGFLVLYFGLLRLDCHRVAAGIIGILYLLNPFLHPLTSEHLMTEPLHVLLMLVIIFGAIDWMRTRRPLALLFTAAVVGLDYLTRPNGLFVMASLLGALGVADVCTWIVRRKFPSLPWIGKQALLYIAAIVVFLVVATPSWLPRLHYFGSPFYHGYLSNYMWVDTYDEGHVGQVSAIYHFSDYAKSHTVADAVRRMAIGVWHVGFYIPYRSEGNTVALFFLALAGVVFVIVRGPAEYRTLVLFGVVQLLPLMWTNMSNPNFRVPYAATFPFELIFAAFVLNKLLDRFMPRSAWTSDGDALPSPTPA